MVLSSHTCGVRPGAGALRSGGHFAGGRPCLPPTHLPRRPRQRREHRRRTPARAMDAAGEAAAGAAQEVVSGLADFQVETGFFYLPSWTGDQLAGLAFGAFMAACFLSTARFDEWVATQQREEMGLCSRCGGLNEPGACAEEKCPMRQQQQQR
mmetsp:Transcript_31682/g.81177  ORF Transcript_31682/g.81177 Transcript_31682/m.81177 type:complete len:153 (+) Transcript_31682:65-523(+)